MMGCWLDGSSTIGLGAQMTNVAIINALRYIGDEEDVDLEEM